MAKNLRMEKCFHQKQSKMTLAMRWKWMSSNLNILNLLRMADFFHVFDSMLDSIFVVDETSRVVYCNEPAAVLFQTSARRVIGKALISELVEFSELAWPFAENSPGWSGPSPLIETSYRALKGEHQGKIQMTISPVFEGADRRWVFFAHDVSLEERLSAKYRAEL